MLEGVGRKLFGLDSDHKNMVVVFTKVMLF